VGTTAPATKVHVKDGSLRMGVTAYSTLDSIGLTARKIIYTPRSTGDVDAGTGITEAMLGADMRYNGSSAIDITVNPQITISTDGDEISITGLSDTNTLTLDDGDGLQLAGGATMVLGAGDNIRLRYIDTLNVWIEISRSNN
jgi:hypothetical protein